VLSGSTADSVALGTPGMTIAAARLTRNATYSRTSPTVRVSPRVNGTRPGQGASRIVPGRAQNSTPPVIGLNLPAMGPHDPASPRASRNIVHITSFW
jgi:hypothetical protein